MKDNNVVLLRTGGKGDNTGGSGNTGGGNPPGGDTVEARVARLESDIEYIKRDVSELAHSAKVIQGDVSVLKTQSAVLLERTAHLEKNMVTQAQLATYAAVVLVTVVGGAWWVIQQYLAPLIAALPK